MKIKLARMGWHPLSALTRLEIGGDIADEGTVVKADTIGKIDDVGSHAVWPTFNRPFSHLLSAPHRHGGKVSDTCRGRSAATAIL